MSVTTEYKQARDDYERLCELHDDSPPEDLTGGFVIDETCFELLRRPTMAHAGDTYGQLIDHGAVAGFEGVGPVRWSDPEVAEILERHGCDRP